MKRLHSEMTKHLLAALLRIKKGRPSVINIKRKLSVASLAEEAGTTRANIYNNYPEIIKSVQLELDGDLKSQKKNKENELRLVKKSRTKHRKEIEELRYQVRKLTSQNATLNNEVIQLRSVVKNKNISTLI